MQNNEIGFFFNMKFYRHLSYNEKYDVRLECVNWSSFNHDWRVEKTITYIDKMIDQTIFDIPLTSNVVRFGCIVRV